jgi:hypothetical protein
MSEMKLTDREVIERAANALTTARGCMGRGKSARCLGSFEHYKAIAESRGIALPSVDDLAKSGQFNGPGSC